MDAKLIATLCANDPRLKRLPSALAPTTGPQPLDITAQARARFSSAYTNVSYGWDIANAYSAARVKMPVTCCGLDHWLFKAYQLRRDCRQWPDADVIDAWGLANLEESREVKTKLCSLLIAGCGQDPDKHRRAVSVAMKIPIKVVEAFSVLFYNILDRAGDATYISQHVYPHTRMVALAEDYLKITDVADLVKRSSFNHRDLEMSAYFAGYGDDAFMAKLAAKPDREQELTRHLMGNALMLVHAGTLNQKTVGMQRAQGLIAAARQSGPTAEAPAVADATIFMADALRAALASHSEQRVSIAIEDAGG